MAKVQQTASELSRTLAGQMTKTEKRAKISRSIAEYKRSAAAKVKAFKQGQLLSK